MRKKRHVSPSITRSVSLVGWEGKKQNCYLDPEALKVRRHLLERDHLAMVGRRGVFHLFVKLGQVGDVGFVHLGGADVAERSKR